MTEQEQRIWDNVYSAIFAREHWDRARNCDSSSYCGHDRAEQEANAEYAGSIADLAVTRLIQWREEEDPELGVVLGEYYFKEKA